MTCKNLWRQLSIVCAVTVLSTALTACSREKEDWRSAQAADTVAAFEQFLREHPASEQATAATTRVSQLAEEDDWQRATTEDSLQGYQQFLARHPEGKWTQEARIRVENFAIADPAAPPADSPAAVMADLAKAGTAASPAVAPAAAPAQAKPSVVVAAVQLGAFSTASAAESQWQQIAGRLKSELGGLKHRVVTGKVASGTVHRLQVPLPSEAAARQLCAKLAAVSQACVLATL